MKNGEYFCAVILYARKYRPRDIFNCTSDELHQQYDDSFRHLIEPQRASSEHIANEKNVQFPA